MIAFFIHPHIIITIASKETEICDMRRDVLSLWNVLYVQILSLDL